MYGFMSSVKRMGQQRGKPQWYDPQRAAATEQHGKPVTPDEAFQLKNAVNIERIGIPEEPREITAQAELDRCPFTQQYIYTHCLGAGSFGFVGAFVHRGSPIIGAPAVAVKFLRYVPHYYNPALQQELIVHELLMSMLPPPSSSSSMLVTEQPAPFVKLYDFTRCQLDLLYVLTSVMDSRKPSAAKALVEHNTMRRALRAETLMMLIVENREYRDAMMLEFRRRDPHIDFSKPIPGDVAFAAGLSVYTAHFGDPLPPPADAPPGAQLPLLLVPPTWQIHIMELAMSPMPSFFEIEYGGMDAFFTNDELFFATMAQVFLPLAQLGTIVQFVHGDLHLKNVLRTHMTQHDSELDRVFFSYPSTRSGQNLLLHVPLSHTVGERFMLNDFGFAHVSYAGARHIQTPGMGQIHEHQRDTQRAVTTGYNAGADVFLFGLALLREMIGEALEKHPKELNCSVQVAQFIRSMFRADYDQPTAEEAQARYGIAYRAAYQYLISFLSVLPSAVIAPSRKAMFASGLLLRYNAASLSAVVNELWHRPLSTRIAVDPTPLKLMREFIEPRYSQPPPPKSIVYSMALRAPDLTNHALLRSRAAFMPITITDPLGLMQYSTALEPPRHTTASSPIFFIITTPPPAATSESFACALSALAAGFHFTLYSAPPTTDDLCRAAAFELVLPTEAC